MAPLDFERFFLFLCVYYETTNERNKIKIKIKKQHKAQHFSISCHFISIILCETATVAWLLKMELDSNRHFKTIH